MSTVLTATERHRPGSLRDSVRRLFSNSRSDSRPGMFDRAQNTSIQNASFTINQYGALAIDRPPPFPGAGAEEQSPGGRAAAASSQAHEHDPSARPRRESPDVYVDCLLTKNRGYPLWIPSPDRSLPIFNRTLGVLVGDVGILTPEGGFDFVFNIFHDATHPINAALGVPDAFTPFTPAPTAADTKQFFEWKAGSFLADASIVRVDDGRDQSTIILEATSVESAALMIPEDIHTTKLRMTTRLRKYVEENIVEWYRFVKYTLGHDIENGDLRVVYGCRKSAGFGIATAFNTGRRENTRLTFSVAGPWVDISRCPYRWSHTGSAEVKAGHSGEDNIGVFSAEPIRNQCLFVNTIDARVSAESWKIVDLEPNTAMQVTPASTVGEPNPTGKHGPITRPGESGLMTGASSSPCYESTFHPSAILQDILETITPGLPAYIVCDDDWAPFLSDSTSNARDLVDQLLGNRIIVEEQGMLFFCAENDVDLLEEPLQIRAAHIRFRRIDPIENSSNGSRSYWQAERCVNASVGGWAPAAANPSTVSRGKRPEGSIPVHWHASETASSGVDSETSANTSLVTPSPPVVFSQHLSAATSPPAGDQVSLGQQPTKKSARSAAAASPSTRPFPYARRLSNQPKTSRYQTSTCGACRMRRVRCDLKVLPADFIGPRPACSNCKERGIKCVDEFADVKAVKLLRRGRRLQQVEAIYGGDPHPKHNNASPGASSSPAISIPRLQPEFFLSSFWRWFSQQRPILDSTAFPARVHADLKGTYSLPNEGSLIAMILVAWAASFGLDERGLPLPEGTEDRSTFQLHDAHASQIALGEGSSSSVHVHRHQPQRPDLRAWKARAEAYVRKVLHFIDSFGILRRPSWDGVQALLLLLPLLEDAQSIERLVVHEITLSHIQALCASYVPVTASEGGGGPSSGQSDASPYDDAAARARTFYYAYTQEGITTGMRGGRFFLDNDDFDAFQRALPSDNYGGVDPPSVSSANLDAFSLHSPPFPPDRSSASAHLSFAPPSSPSSSTTGIPLAIGAICRRIHSVLTCSKALRQAEEHGLVDAHGMRDIWRDLERCWGELEAWRWSMQAQAQDANNATAADRSAEADQYVIAWQIFIFECHNVIREVLKRCIAAPTQQSPTTNDDVSPLWASSHSHIGTSSSATTSSYQTPHQLHVTAMRKCAELLPRVIFILRRALQYQQQNQMSFGPGVFEGPSIFRWDAGLVRDGCFFAGYLAANTEANYICAPLPSEDESGQDVIGASLRVGTDEGVRVCLAALNAMRWGFSKTEEREDTIRMIWDIQRMWRQGQEQGRYVGMHEEAQADYSSGALGGAMHSYHHVTTTMSSNNPHLGIDVGGMAGDASGERPRLPNVFEISHPAQGRHLQQAPHSQVPHPVNSPPSTTSSLPEDRALSGWPVSYMPPGTTKPLATSARKGPVLGASRRSPPIFSTFSSLNAAGPYGKPPPQPQHWGGNMFKFHTSASEQQFTYDGPPLPPPHYHSSHRQTPAGMGMDIEAVGYGVAAGTPVPADSDVRTLERSWGRVRGDDPAGVAAGGWKQEETQ